MPESAPSGMSTTDRVGSLEASIRREAASRGVAAYLVGGTVRDRLRRRVPRDVDVAIVGDAIHFARLWAPRVRGAVEAAPSFGTASVLVDGPRPLRVDFSSTRGETYRHAGALPDVFPAGIAEDLARRDFTINAMAIPLTGPHVGNLLDPFGGRDDLRRKTIRMLHRGSPYDDPTRAFRCVRFALRFGFRIARQTRRWIAEARSAGAFAAVSGDRLRREIFLLLREQSPLHAVAGLGRIDLVRAIDPSLAVTSAVRRRFKSLEGAPLVSPADRTWAALIAWALDLSPDARARVADRLQIAGARRAELGRAPDDRRALDRLFASHAPDSEIASLSRQWSAEECEAIASALSRVRRTRFLRARRRGDAVLLAIGGADLKRCGLAPGPAIGRALEQTWRARVDRRIRRAGELRYALREGSR